jgi:PAS domain-containing protein
MVRGLPTHIAGKPSDDVERLVHELRIRQVELELQSEELRITERKRAEQALRDREGRLRAILNTAADAKLPVAELDFRFMRVLHAERQRSATESRGK